MKTQKMTRNMATVVMILAALLMGVSPAKAGLEGVFGFAFGGSEVRLTSETGFSAMANIIDENGALRDVASAANATAMQIQYGETIEAVLSASATPPAEGVEWFEDAGTGARPRDGARKIGVGSMRSRVGTGDYQIGANSAVWWARIIKGQRIERDLKALGILPIGHLDPKTGDFWVPIRMNFVVLPRASFRSTVAEQPLENTTEMYVQSDLTTGLEAQINTALGQLGDNDENLRKELLAVADQVRVLDSRLRVVEERPADAQLYDAVNELRRSVADLTGKVGAIESWHQQVSSGSAAQAPVISNTAVASALPWTHDYRTVDGKLWIYITANIDCVVTVATYEGQPEWGRRELAAGKTVRYEVNQYFVRVVVSGNNNRRQYGRNGEE